MSLTHKRVVIIGGTSGIGLATAHAAVDAGAEVIIASSRQSSIDAALGELSAAATGHALDVLDTAAVQAFFEEAGEFDHLAYTAGESLSLMPVDGMNIDQARGFFQVRFFGALNAVSIAAKHIRPGGSITLTSGSARTRPGAGWSVASSLCGATTSLASALAVELAPIRVNVVEPGIIRSPLWSGMSVQDQQAMYNQQAELLPAGRVGEVDDVAQAFLYSMTQSFMTGTAIPVDGGALLV
ncbi:NAD(P)-dependent dehydrogenase, short-chain alcohol dehydrogenase family [Nakamurella panacisegetis]|uniref:NAD(P)-dependent dehydrogenase, short-chain alcohol dehydrogenase family n=1 Tax=Nakamurella panacisegetis TaxID=1090615 RepID=A0A1H0IW91_9ACTN|nr:SDR family oxidoreductase [Nakamurella panacisegetis]SDO35726.1 NAD(P)-dependent dehydrogenase, short-chain alcohol dehydrogenase family [Nakamurella panacisegetis]